LYILFEFICKNFNDNKDEYDLNDVKRCATLLRMKILLNQEINNNYPTDPLIETSDLFNKQLKIGLKLKKKTKEKQTGEQKYNNKRNN